MTPTLPQPPLRRIPVTLRITRADIEAMDYWLNEAPMSDPEQHNAIVFALGRILRGDLSPRLEAPSSTGEPVSLLIAGISLALPPVVTSWWNRARTGHRMEPLVTSILLPRPWLRPLPLRQVAQALPALALWKRDGFPSRAA